MPSHRLLVFSIITATLFASIRRNNISMNRASWLNALIVVTPWIVSAKCDKIGETVIFSMRCNSLNKIQLNGTNEWKLVSFLILKNENHKLASNGCFNSIQSIFQITQIQILAEVVICAGRINNSPGWITVKFLHQIINRTNWNRQ